MGNFSESPQHALKYRSFYQQEIGSESLWGTTQCMNPFVSAIDVFRVQHTAACASLYVLWVSNPTLSHAATTPNTNDMATIMSELTVNMSMSDPRWSLLCSTHMPAPVCTPT
jgi:hypothetical protein